VTGVGVAVLVAGGVVGAMTLGKIHDLEKKCPDNGCPAQSYADDVGSVRTFVRATDYLLLVGGALSASGLVWLIASGGLSSSSSAPKSEVTAACTGEGCMGSWRLAF
jgi:hypothetical protein